jgi:hypothetical protein
MTILDEPLIYTSLGNMPVSELEHYVGWEVTAEYVKFREVYKFQGEIVKESAHVHALNGHEMGAFIPS